MIWTKTAFLITRVLYVNDKNTRLKCQSFYLLFLTHKSFKLVQLQFLVPEVKRCCMILLENVYLLMFCDIYVQLPTIGHCIN